MTTSQKIKSKACELASSRAFAALSHTVASWPARRNARASDARVLASSSTIKRFACCGTDRSSKCSGGNLLCSQFVGISRQLNHEGGSSAGVAAYADSSSVIADNRLHNGQPEPGAMRLAGVIRREQTLTLLGREPSSGVSHLDYRPLAFTSRAQAQ